MSIENITAKILEDAREYADSAIADARKEETAILVDAKKQATGILESYKEKSAADAEMVKSRKASVAELEARKMMLAAKQDAVAKSFQKAIEKIAGLKDEEYIDFLASLAKDIAADGGEICLNKKDKEAVGEKLVQKINSGSKRKKVTLSKSVIQSKGGFILKNGPVSINATLETVINAVKEDATSQIAEILFR